MTGLEILGEIGLILCFVAFLNVAFARENYMRSKDFQVVLFLLGLSLILIF